MSCRERITPIEKKSKQKVGFAPQGTPLDDGRMKCRLHYRRYRLLLRAPLRTARGVWTEREGLMVRLEAPNGRVGFGEAATLPWFGTETAEEAGEACGKLGADVDAGLIAQVPAKFACLRNALAAAHTEVAGADAVRTVGRPKPLPVAALLPAGRSVLERIAPLAEAGFRVFKWKVGVGDLADELALLDDVCALLPEGAKLRLDANGAWQGRQAERWLERAAERPIEFIEQPCYTETSQGAALHRRSEDLLLGLARDFPTPIALDESLVGDGDVAHWLELGWPGVFIVKPSLCGDPVAVMARLGTARASVVISSALETAVGAKTALGLAFRWNQPARALGFGVWPLFADTRFDGPALAPFLRWEDVVRIDQEAVWNELS
jgi:O-succinylbenzoate synthase